MGTFGQVSNLQCTACSSRCQSCFGASFTECHNCTSFGGTNYFLQYGTTSCGDVCPDGEYANTTDFTCKLCSAECLTCVTSPSNCLTCGFSQYGMDLFKSGTQCLASCPTSFWGNTATHTCDACTPGCLSCTTSGLTNCQSCANVSTTQYYKIINQNTCSLTCPDGQYIDSAFPNDCQPCASNCITCSGTADHCTNTNCSVNFYFLNNSCLATCPADFYYPDSSSRLCQTCASGCLKCFGPLLTQCSECDLVSTTQYYLQVGKTECATSCPTGEFGEVANKSCVSCPSVCASCTSSSVCQSCQSLNGVAYYLEGSSCTVSCPSNKYGNVGSLTC